MPVVRVACIAGLCGALSVFQLAMAQTSVAQGTDMQVPASPTSLEPDDPYALPRTRDGYPDLQGEVWAIYGATYLQGGAGNVPLTIPESQQKAAFDRILAPFLNNPEFKMQPDGFDYILGMDGLPLVRGERRTRLLVVPADGRLPLTEAARKELATPNPAAIPKSDGPEGRTVTERCLVSSDLSPLANLFNPGIRSFIQTRDHLVIHFEYGDEARIVPFAEAMPESAPPGRYGHGDSFARWDGDTLVIETTNLPAWQRRRFLPAYLVNADATVIERYTRVSGDELLYQFTVVDPEVFSAPWLAEYSLYRSALPFYPATCHEANYSMRHILAGQRAAEGWVQE